jgi:hypothetical protein
MKRSEMLSRLAHTLEYYKWSGTADEFADHILNFLEQQGMQPPTYAVSLDEDSRTHTTILMWEPEDKA